MANITMEKNRSSKGDIIIADDQEGINIKSSGVKLITDGAGNSFLSDDGTYKPLTGPGTTEKQASYLLGFTSIDGYIRPLPLSPSHVFPLSLLFVSTEGNPVISTSATGWVLEAGDYTIDMSIMVIWDNAVATLVDQDQFHVLISGLDLSGPPTPDPVIITVPYQGQLTNDIRVFHRITFPIPAIGASNNILIEIYYTSSGGPQDFYLLQANNPALIQSNITFTQINTP